MEKAPDDEHKSFTVKHFAGFLLDAGKLDAAEKLLEAQLPHAISEDARYGLKSVLANVWMKQLAVPYDQELLEKLKDTLWDTLQYLEKADRKAETGLLLLDATQIANISGSFSEALGYITKAIRLFDEEELTRIIRECPIAQGDLTLYLGPER